MVYFSINIKNSIFQRRSFGILDFEGFNAWGSLATVFGGTKQRKRSDLRDDNLDTATYTLLPTTFKMELDWKKDEGMGIMSFYKTF